VVDLVRRAIRTRATAIRSFLVAAGLVAILVGLFTVWNSSWDYAARSQPYDFDINLVAAHRLLDGEPLYDRAASREDGIELIGPWMVESNMGPFSSYIGPPSTALTYTPFTGMAHDDARDLYRAMLVAGIALAIVLTSLVLPRRARVPAALVGFGSLLGSFSVAKAVALANVDHWVILGMAVGVYAASRERWRLAGVGLGVATLLKVSPGLLLAYLVLRRKWEALAAAVATWVVMLGVAAIVGRPGDVWVWLHDVSGEVSKGDVNVDNQALPAFIARLFTGRTNLNDQVPLGDWRFLAYAIGAAGLLALWRATRRQALDPLDLGILVLVALLAGPISWDHYAAWAVIPLVLVCDVTRWERVSTRAIVVLSGMLATMAVLLRFGTHYWSPDQFAAHWMLRLATGTKTYAILLLLGAALWLRFRAPQALTDEAAEPAAMPELTEVPRGAPVT
jgi:hypothetical protein